MHKQHFGTYAASFVFILVLLVSVVGSAFVPEDVRSFLGNNRLYAALLFAALMCVATVIAPITLLPVVPMIAPFLGPFTTAVACLFGWTVGAVVAFLIARYGGRPLLQRFVNLDTIGRLESTIPVHAHFALIVALRLVVPVDVLSYALGIFSTVSLSRYTLASFLGISWFSFIFAYMGDAFAHGKTVLLWVCGVASFFVVLTALWYLTRVKKGDENKK